jgi:beta-galactosidase
MNHKSTIFKAILIFMVAFMNLNAQVILPDKAISGADIQSLNGTWKFRYFPSLSCGADSVFYKADFNDREWKDIKVPGHWELQGFAEPQYGGAVKPGTGLYRTVFFVPENRKAKQMFIVFDGVLYGFDVWINGRYAGSWGSSFNRQMFDITNYVVAGKSNLVAVKVTTRNKGWEFDTNDCWGLSGIFRDVTLISVPETHIKDFTVKTYLNGSKSSRIDVSVLVENSSGSKSTGNFNLSAKLWSPGGKIVREFNSVVPDQFIKNNTVSVSNSLMVENPLMWTAETPWLYNLELTLKSDGKEIQRIHQKIGIRQVTIENGIFRLNGQAVKLRGVDHHDINPEVGRALTDEMILNDLLLMKRANVNFIRTSHYPSHPKMIEYCDSLGIYVMCEVPFGYDGNHLEDTTYLEILLKRADATLLRDKNHPSVIIWSIGNENPLTKICLETGDFVKKLDNTRPICYPQVGTYFKENYKNIPASVDLFTPHYGDAKTLENYARLFDRPIISTEYAHALGLDFDKVESMWEVMYRYPRIAGGAVWHFHDQGILRKADKKVDVNSFTYSAWPDSIHYYDTSGNKGADGLVYANRIPQVDYWELRKVYSPVKALDDSILIKPGHQIVKIRINNRFDFKDLSDIRCKWTLMADNKLIQEGILSLKCPPHDTITIPVTLSLPEKISGDFYLLNLRFIDPENYQFNEKTYRLWSSNYSGIRNRDLIKVLPGKVIAANEDASLTLKSGNTLFSVGKQNGNIKIENTGRKQVLLEGPFARVGRKTTMSILTLRLKDTTGVSTNWDPYTLSNTQATVNSISQNKVQCNYKFERMDKKGEFIGGSVVYAMSDSGWIDVNYSFTPVNATAFFLEAGISFSVPADFSELRWIGNGPYPSYPGKSMLNEFGFYHLNSSDINYQGNRSNVRLLLMTDKNGNGFAVNCKNADLAVEKTNGGLLLSHNALVSGRYNKNSGPEFLYKASNVKSISGSFSIVPVSSKETPSVLLKLFGNLSKTVKPFKPFYHSYDQ